MARNGVARVHAGHGAKRRARAALVLAGASLCAAAAANDWPYWRGPEQTGTSRENAPVKSWSPDGDNLLWKSDIGGRTTPVIMNGRVFYICPVDVDTACTAERVVCLDAESGKILWQQRFNVFLTDVVENRVGWPALVGDPSSGNVYAHATSGEFFCFSRDGEMLWKRSLTEEFGRISGYGGRIMTPILDEDRVIVSFLNSSWGSQARPLHRYLHLDKSTGEVALWAETPGVPLDTTYATPAVAVIGGRRLLIAPAADGNVYGMRARTGRIVWTYRLSKRGLNTSVVTDGERAYVSHSEENLSGNVMGAVLCIDASKEGDITESGTVWRNDGLQVGYASPAIANGRLYVVDNSATLFALDARSGEVFWEYSLGRVGKGSPTVTADGVIYVGEQNGVFHIIQDEGGHPTPLSRVAFDRADGLVDEIFGSPAVANGRVYFMTRYGMYCLGSGPAGRRDAPLQPLAEEPRPGDQPPLTLVTPAEVTLRPGDSRRFESATWSHGGLRVAEGNRSQTRTWRLTGVAGTIDDAGTFAAAGGGAYSGGFVEVQWAGEAPARARVRVVPDLPIELSFDEMKTDDVPPGWVGVGGGPKKKCVVSERDGGKVLMKLAKKEEPSPPFMRLQPYITPVIAGGFTIECDMLSELKDAGRRSYLPDMGLTNSRYQLVLVGADKKRGKPTMLRMETWGTVPRIRQEMAFDWQPDVWYRVKFEVVVEGTEAPRHEGAEGSAGAPPAGARGPAGARAIVHGKIWPREQAEPQAWSIEFTDECPNTEGAAGVYAYSTGTTPSSDGPATYFDNLRIYK